MLTLIITSIISFASTNIDDIFVLMLFFSQTDDKLKNRHIILGQYLGIGILVGLSLLGVFGIQFVPERFIGLLGIIPIVLGVKAWIEYKKNKINTDDDESGLKKSVNSGIISVILVTVANGADNIGVYIPLFAAYSLYQLVIVIFIFIIMIGLWCFAGYRIANFPKIKLWIQKYKNYIVPIIFIGIGIFILLENYF